MTGLIIAGERSGSGKTTVTLALLAALQQRIAAAKLPHAFPVQAFKVGPDYIDPMFHRYVTGRPSYNLDPVLSSETYVRQSFNRYGQKAAVVVEGVMGLFDGADSQTDIASTAHIARLLDLSVLLVVDCSRLSRSIAAIVHGYRSFDPRLSLAGVVLNRVASNRHLELLKGALSALEVPILGVLRREDAIAIPDRHLGLVPTAELSQLDPLIDRLRDLGQRCFDWPQLTPLLQPRPAIAAGKTPLPFLPPSPPSRASGPQLRPRIAVAMDAAFSFYYPDNLEILEALGAELLPWSPLQDSGLPDSASGLYFGGGFPEMFAADLAANQPVLQQVRRAIAAGMPTYAECGGLMYLCQHLVDFEGNSWPLVGSLPASVRMEKRLTLGYRQATALQASPLIKPSESVWGHEFHRSALTTDPPQPLFNLQRYGATTPHGHEGWQTHRLHASYVHLHWGGCPQLAQRFVAACQAYTAAAPG